jgi:hypothetical protein
MAAGTMERLFESNHLRTGKVSVHTIWWEANIRTMAQTASKKITASPLFKRERKKVMGVWVHLRYPEKRQMTRNVFDHPCFRPGWLEVQRQQAVHRD